MMPRSHVDQFQPRTEQPLWQLSSKFAERNFWREDDLEERRMSGTCKSLAAPRCSCGGTRATAAAAVPDRSLGVREVSGGGRGNFPHRRGGGGTRCWREVFNCPWLKWSVKSEKLNHVDETFRSSGRMLWCNLFVGSLAPKNSRDGTNYESLILNSPLKQFCSALIGGPRLWVSGLKQKRVQVSWLSKHFQHLIRATMNKSVQVNKEKKNLNHLEWYKLDDPSHGPLVHVCWCSVKLCFSAVYRKSAWRQNLGFSAAAHY